MRASPAFIVAVVVSLSCSPGIRPDAFEACQASCPGCCSLLGVCFAGEADLSCGRQGNLCQACEGGRVCHAGTCGFPGGGAGGGTGFGGGLAGAAGGSPQPGPALFAEPFRATAHQPAPAMGGTLTLVDDTLAVVADPDRERVLVVDLLGGGGVQGSIQLPAGSRPTRSVVDSSGKVHMLLRGAGKVLSLDPLAVTTAGTGVLGTSEVCAEPRGIAVDGPQVVVACRSGELVRFTPGGQASVTMVGEDLRDVLVRPGELAVTSFRSATITALGSGKAARPAVAPDVQLAPGVAWRTVDSPVGTFMLHQLASTAELSALGPPGPGGAQSTYGGGSGPGEECNPSVVRTALSRFTAGLDAVDTYTLGVPSALVGAVDLAVAPSSGLHTCNGTSDCPPVPVAAVVGPNGAHLYRLDPVPGGAEGGPLLGRACEEHVSGGGARTSTFLLPLHSEDGDYSGVAFKSNGDLVIHERGQAAIHILRHGVASRRIPLFDDGVDTAGSRLFHAAHRGGAGIACASCHPEGGEDGHVWRVNGTVRRTQSLEGGVMGRAPFHWSGDLPTLTSLMGDTFTQRMGVGLPPPEFVTSLGAWLDTLPPARGRPVPTHRVDAGRGAFLKAGCEACHAGAQLTTNLVTSVGTGGLFKTPSLKGVSARGPWMHDGCARTLHQRFIPPCGGSAHGNPGVLDAIELDDLVAYLESL